MQNNKTAVLNDKIKEILASMNISKAIVIDDRIGQSEKVEEAEMVLCVLNGYYDSPEFDIKYEMERAGIDIDEQLEKAEHGEVDENVLKICLKAFPEQINTAHSEINELLNVVKEIFGDDNYLTYTNTSEVQDRGLDSDTILFLDYKIDGASPRMSQELVRVLSEKDDPLKPRCIIFISKDPIFYIDEKKFTMSNPIEKSLYFREIKKLQAEKNYKNSLYDFISKHSLKNKTEIYEVILDALYNLHGGLIFYDLLKAIDNILIESSQKVLDKFYLLNARSLQEVLKSKVENEGLAKPIFLIEWISKHIAKTVVRNDGIVKEIDEKLKNIGQSKFLINEFLEDVSLKEIICSEMWDSTVNKRFEPVDFGDVFEIECNGVNSKAILMTQPCTLTVRKDGKRASKTGMLVLERKDKSSDNGSPRHLTINNWDNEDITFSLDDTITFSLEILDLTTINADGQAVITVKEKNNEVLMPEAFWADGYKAKLEKLTREIINTADARKFCGSFGFMPIEQSWLEYKIENEGENRRYIFPIKRLARLDNQYSMHIFQKAQSWWGRVGLPVQLDLIDEYKPKLGSILINNLNKSITLYEKRGMNGNNVIDCCIDLNDMHQLISEIYSHDIESFEYIRKLLYDNRALKYNCASGKRLLSLQESKDGIQYLNKKGIYINFSSEHNIESINPTVIVKLPYFSKCFYNGNEVTGKISNTVFTQNGELRCNIPVSIVDKSSFLGNCSRLIVEDNSEKVLKFSENKLKEFLKADIKESELYITELDQEVAVTEMVSE